MAKKYDKKFLENLAEKVINNKATESEKLFLDEYYRAFDNQPDITDQLSDEEFALLKGEIKARLIEETGKPQAKVISWYNRGIYRAAAASVVIGLSLTLLFVVYKRPFNQIAAHKTDDVQPGGNKAILKLANGTRIVLNDMKNGLVASRGNTAITKRDSGELVYNNTHVQARQGTANAATTFDTLTTPRGGICHVVLADGSVVWLNAATSVRFPENFINGERKVELIYGEAYFEVIHNVRLPFRVMLHGQEIEDLGTHFNINSYTDEGAVVTTLLEGSIKVKVTNATKRPGNTEVKLEPGQQARFAENQISVLKSDNPGQVIAWKEGLFKFENSGIEQILRQAARWYNVEVSYRGAIPEKKFGGEISRNVPLSKFLEILRFSGINIRAENRKIIVTQ